MNPGPAHIKNPLLLGAMTAASAAAALAAVWSLAQLGAATPRTAHAPAIGPGEARAAPLANEPDSRSDGEAQAPFPDS